MNTFKVTVEKKMYASGVVEIKAKDADEAQKEVNELINSGKLQTTDVEWDDAEYEDGSFGTTGDVE